MWKACDNLQKNVENGKQNERKKRREMKKVAILIGFDWICQRRWRMANV